MNTYALIVAAGKSVRFGGDVPKQFRQVCGRPLLSWTISRFEQASEIDKIVIVASEEHAPFVADRVIDEYGFMKVEKIVTGGETRQQSVANGLQSLPSSTSLVAIHDGARPLVRPDDVDRVVAAARSDGCAMLAAPVTDTVKRGREGLVMATLDRSNLHLAQTPQAFLFDLIRRAHDEDRGGDATDDAVLMEQAGHKVRLVGPTGPNFKVTTADDLVMVEALLRREGHGQA